MDVRGKTILVTGAGRGIGRSLATHFAGKGANLALLDRNAEDVEQTTARCTAFGVVARSYIADAANEDSVVGAIDQVVVWVAYKGSVIQSAVGCSQSEATAESKGAFHAGECGEQGEAFLRHRHENSPVAPVVANSSRGILRLRFRYRG